MRLAGLSLWLLALVGCQEGGAALWLEVDSDLLVPGELDELRLRVSASRSLQGSFCRPTERSFQLSRGEDLPLLVVFEPGAEYNAWLTFQVTGLKEGAEVLALESRSGWPESGDSTVSIFLARGCLTMPCEAERQCVSGVCVARPTPSAFEGGLEDAAPCEP